MSEPFRILLSALHDATPGEYWTAAEWHEPARIAQLRSAEVAAAHQDAVDSGYLVRVVVRVGARTAAVQVPSTVPSRKGGGVQLYVRTARPLPGQPVHEHHREPGVCDGQTDLLEEIGA